MTKNNVMKAEKPLADTPKKAERPRPESEPQSPSSPLSETPKNPTEITIDPELRDLLAPLSEAEHDLLEKDICEHGCVTPITIDQNGTLVEGHNRYGICTKHSIPFSIRVLHFESREATIQWMLEHQLGRRNLTDFQRAEIALQLKPMIAAQAKANQKAGGGVVPEISPKPVDTREEVAKLAGTSSNTMSKVEYILKNGDEETKAKLRRGEQGTSINKVYKELKALNEPKTPDGGPNAPTSPNGQPVNPVQKPEKKPTDEAPNTDPPVAETPGDTSPSNSDVVEQVSEDRVEALLAQVRKSHEDFSKDELTIFADGLHQFLVDIDYLEPEESGDTSEEADDAFDDSDLLKGSEGNEPDG